MPSLLPSYAQTWLKINQKAAEYSLRQLNQYCFFLWLTRLFDQFVHLSGLWKLMFLSFSRHSICPFRVGSAGWRANGPGHLPSSLHTKKVLLRVMSTRQILYQPDRVRCSSSKMRSVTFNFADWLEAIFQHSFWRSLTYLSTFFPSSNILFWYLLKFFLTYTSWNSF